MALSPAERDLAAKAFREACTELAKKLALALGSKATSLRVSKKPDFHGFFPKSAYTLFGSFQLSPNNLTAEETSLKLKKTFMPLGFTGRGFVPSTERPSRSPSRTKPSRASCASSTSTARF